MANSLTGGYGLRPIGITGMVIIPLVQLCMKLPITTLLRFIKVALLFL